MNTFTINNAPPENPAMDFHFLRQEGIKHIQRLAGNLWSDHNLHDPGITILEQLCYAITDLGYRIGYDMEDLLATTDGSNPYAGLFSPAEILTTSPVTATDFRKMLIDMTGIKNAWIEKTARPAPAFFYNHEHKTLTFTEDLTTEPVQIKGLYRILLEKEGTTASENIREKAEKQLHASRSVCEDFENISIMPSEEVTIKATIEIGGVEDANRLLAEVYHRLDNSISTSIRFYTLEQLLKKGQRVDEIFDGAGIAAWLYRYRRT